MSTQKSEYQTNQHPSRYTSIFDLLIDPAYQIRLLWQHKLEIMGLVLVSGLLGALAAFAVEPTYRSTASLMIQPRGADIAPIRDIYQNEDAKFDYVLTRHEILRSKELAGRVVDILDLTEQEQIKKVADKTAGKTPRWKVLMADLPLINRLSDYFKKNDVQDVPVDEREYAIAKVRGAVQVEAVPMTYIVKIHAVTREPGLSAKIANTLMEAYLQFDSGERQDITAQAGDWLTTRLEELKRDLEESEKKLQEFYESEDLVNIGGARQLLTDDYSDYSERLRDAHRKKVELASVYRKIKDANGDVDKLQDIAYIQDKDLVKIAKREYFSADEKVSELSSRYGPKHPKMIAAKNRRDQAKAAYGDQLRQTAEAASSAYEFAVNTEMALTDSVGTSRMQLTKLDRKQHELEALQNSVETNKQLFDSFLQRYKETDISANLESTNNKIIDRAVPSNRPYSPNKKLWVLSFTVVGFMISFLFTFIRGYLDDTVKSPDSMEELTGTPTLAVLPTVKSLSKKAQKMARIELDDPTSVYSESIRTLRTSLVLSDASKKTKKILVASSVPAEGKTCVAANLAIAFGQVEKTLLIDCDLRRPACANYLGIAANSVGLVEILAGGAPVREAIKRFEEANIDLLSCVTPPPNPSELLSSKRFEVLLDRLAEHYDRIILDSPPSQVVSDVFLLAGKVDAIIFLAKAESTYRRTIADAVERLRQADGKILGTVLNQVDLHKTSQYGMYYYPEYYGLSKEAKT